MFPPSISISRGFPVDVPAANVGEVALATVWRVLTASSVTTDRTPLPFIQSRGGSRKNHNRFSG